MLPCEWVMSPDARLYRVPGHTRAVSIAKCEMVMEIQRCGEMPALWSQWEPKENVCIPSSSRAACLDLWFLLYILCTYALMVMVLSVKHLHQLKVSCPQHPGGLGGEMSPASRTLTAALLWSGAWSGDMLDFRKQESWRVDWHGRGKASIIFFPSATRSYCHFSKVWLISFPAFFLLCDALLLFSGLTNSRSATILSAVLLLLFAAKCCRSRRFT